MGLITREKIKGAKDSTQKRVDVPEWEEDGYVFVKTISAFERDQLDNTLFDFNPETGQVTRNAEDFRTKWVLRTACDEEGNLIFSQNDLEWLREKASKPIQRIFDASQQLNGTNRREQENAEKNSETDHVSL